MKEEEHGWTWFMAVNHSGTWIITEGVASARLDDKMLSATLYFSFDSPPYLNLVGTLASDGTA